MNMLIKLNQFLCDKCQKKFYVNVDDCAEKLICPFCKLPVENVRIFEVEIKKIYDKLKQNKIQKRSIEVIEFEDGTYKMICPTWNLDDLKNEEIDEGFIAWRTGKLKEINKK